MVETESVNSPPQKIGAKAAWLNKGHGRACNDGNHKPRKPGARTYVAPGPIAFGDPDQLGSVDDVAVPDIIRISWGNQVLVPVLFQEEIDIGDQPAECFT
jgi:hypothetical protein